MRFYTKEQEYVVSARLSNGYSFIGYYQNLSGIGECDIGLVKGKHRVHINALGYDSFIKGINYQEIR